MQSSGLLIPAVVILSQAAALADGGAVQLRREAAGLVITVFTSPAPLSVGPVDVSVLLQNRTNLEPVLDADVSIVLHSDDGGTEFRIYPTREQARNKLLYAASVAFPKPGRWQIAVTAGRGREENDAAGALEVAPAPGKAVSYSGYIAFPPIMVALFVVRERLIRRRAKR